MDTTQVRKAIMALKWQDYIKERKDVMLGKPVFKGKGLTVEHVLAFDRRLASLRGA